MKLEIPISYVYVIRRCQFIVHLFVIVFIACSMSYGPCGKLHDHLRSYKLENFACFCKERMTGISAGLQAYSFSLEQKDELLLIVFCLCQVPNCLKPVKGFSFRSFFK